MRERIGDVEIIRGDCLEWLEVLRDQGVEVDAVITDPPYGIGIKTQNQFSKSKNLRISENYWDENAPAEYIDISCEMLNEGGIFVAFTAQEFAGALWQRLKDLTFNYVRWFYWVKTNPCPNPLPIYTNSVEVAVIGAKAGKKPYFGGNAVSANYFLSGGTKSADRTDHPTQKNLRMIRKLVRDLCPEGGLVLDPFGGSGTTAVACLIEGRRCITIERDEEYFETMRTRINRWYDSDQIRQMELL